ncbi:MULTISPECIES: antibiotic biosynthesis monooxygenase [Pseudomonas]|uniref:Antibiotic biosynthesis monooxygenase n=1 Tax=Pseudomonas auratipiscis TaxID=3115853 RepID=A0AB35WRA7_9PSED|nr:MULTISPECIES: antibiotic biosynthesis monooxygenase [unclassified Pseudomonas]MEE1866671.1 antibiotic biosynthesis monooxygenase [Pseudomonas sp. 120P]MEE1957446.1 antibiotic biosynthesis monooxygenase [Pseudomonas sp. 119P]
MAVPERSFCFTQMIEFEVVPMRQYALAQALAERSEALALRHAGLIGASIQASDDGSRVLQYLQWQSRTAWEAAASSFEQEPFLQLIQQHQAKGVSFAAFQTVSSLARSVADGLYCHVPLAQEYQGEW